MTEIPVPVPAELPPVPDDRWEAKPWRRLGPPKRATPEEEAAVASGPAVAVGNDERLDACRLHDFRIVPGKRSRDSGQQQFRCARCGGLVPLTYAQAYAFGLHHGLRLAEARFFAYRDSLAGRGR